MVTGSEFLAENRAIESNNLSVTDENEQLIWNNHIHPDLYRHRKLDRNTSQNCNNTVNNELKTYQSYALCEDDFPVAD